MSDTIATAAPIGVAVLDYLAGNPAATGDLAAQVVLILLTVIFGATQSAPLKALGKVLTLTLPGLIKGAVTNWAKGRADKDKQ